MFYLGTAVWVKTNDNPDTDPSYMRAAGHASSLE